MNEDQRYLLKSNRNRISQDLLVSDVFSHLLSTFAITEDEVETVQHEITSRGKAGKLIDIILAQSKNRFQHFYDALLYAEYEHLAQLLKGGLNANNHIVRSSGESDDDDDDEDDVVDVQSLLRDGGVPRLPSVLVQRPTCTESLHKALYDLKENDGCVVLHGMAGCGKTILAIQSLNDEDLIRNCFPGGVFWFEIGNSSEMKLLMKMQNMCSMLDPANARAPRNLEEARDCLRKLFSHEHPKSLLVLDDLWFESQMKYFDLRVRTLITTRNSAIADRINCKKSKMPLTDSFSVNESRSIFSQWTGIEELNLPPEADQIIKECNGYPLAVSMIGALLKSRSSRWSYYLAQLLEKKTSKVRSKLAYGYDSLFDAFAVSLESLSSDLQEKYQKLSVFERGTDIRIEVLSVYWDLDDIDCEDLVLELVDKSLLHIKADNTYSVHAIQLSFLLELVGNDKLMEYHQLLVDRYSHHCSGEFETLKNDGYIHWHLISHLVASGKISVAVRLCCSFAWLKQAAIITASSNVIGSFIEVVEQVTNNESLHSSLDILQQLSQYFRAYSHLVSSKVVDLLQLALCQPYWKDLSQLALEEIMSMRGGDKAQESKWYFIWKNRLENVDNGLQLTSQLHQGGVKSCRFSSSSSSSNYCVVSCGNDKTIRVWNSVTGEQTLVLCGHTDVVNYCEFTPDDKHILSCSADKSIRIWSLDADAEFFSMEGHTDEVTCCRCSPNGQYIVSCSLDKTVKVWSFETKFLTSTMREHTDVVNWCCFSNDSKRIASASNDCTMIIWDFGTDEIVATFYATDFISFCVFVGNDRILCTYLNYIEMFSVTTNASLWCMEAPTNVTSLDLSPSGKFLAASHSDMTASLFEMTNREFVNSYVGHSSWLNGVSFSPDERYVVTASHDGLCKVWSVEDNSSSNMKALTDVFDVVFADKDFILAAASRANTIRVIHSDETTVDSESFECKISSCAIAIDKSMIAAGLKNGSIKILTSENLCIQNNLRNHSEEVVQLKFHENTRLLSSCDKTCTVWCLQKRVVLSVFENHSDSITSCQFISNGNSVISTSYDGTIATWCCTTGNLIRKRYHDDDDSAAVLSCHMSNNGAYIISCCADSTCKLWNASDGSLVLEVDDHEDAIRCGAFSCDDSMFATGSDDGTVKLWCVLTGSLICSCEPHEGWIVDVRFIQTNDTIVSLSTDVKWFRTSGALLQTFHVHGNSLQFLRSTEDFERYITIDNLGYLYILERI